MDQNEPTMNQEPINQEQPKQTLAAPISDAGGICGHRAQLRIEETIQAAGRHWITTVTREFETVGITGGAVRNLRQVKKMMDAIVVDLRPKRLLELLDSARMKGLSLWETPSCSKDPNVWEGTSEELTNWLEQSSVSDAARSLTMELPLSRLVGRLAAAEVPDRVIEHRTTTQRRWKICKPDSTGSPVTPLLG